MTLLHLPHGRGLRHWVTEHLTAHGPGDADATRYGLDLRVNPDCHQIRLTLSWRAATAVGVVIVGLVFGAVLMGIEDGRQLLLSTLSTEQVRAMPVNQHVLEVEPEVTSAPMQ